MHLLEPTQSFAFHVEGSNMKTLVLRSHVIIKELVDLKDPTQRIGAIEASYVDLHDGSGK